MSYGILFAGCGSIAVSHAKTLHKLGVELGFASRDVGRAQQFSSKWGGRWSGCYEDIGSSDFQCVFITTPPHLHLELALQALDAGKDVIVEKPAFFDLADFDTVEAAASKNGRRVLIAENYYYKPLRKPLERVLTDGSIGTPVSFYINAQKRQRVTGWRADAGITGGGALFEGGIHWINLMANLGLPVRDVSVHFPDGQGPMNDRSSTVTFQYEGGPVGTLLYSWEQPSPLKGLRLSRIFGTDGAVAFETNGLAGLVWGKKKRVIWPALGDMSGRKAMLRDFVRALRSDQPAALTFEKARKDYEHLQGAYQRLSSRFSVGPQDTGELSCTG